MKNVKVNDRVWREIRGQVARLAHKRVRVGIVGQAATNDRGGATNAEIGAVHEFGSRDGSIPERSFIRATFREKREQLVALQARLANGVVTLRLYPDRALEQLGAAGAALIKSYIVRDGELTPNAPVTIERKGSSRPLVDTGQLVNSITYVLEEKS